MTKSIHHHDTACLKRGSAESRGDEYMDRHPPVLVTQTERELVVAGDWEALRSAVRAASDRVGETRDALPTSEYEERLRLTGQMQAYNQVLNAITHLRRSALERA